MHEIGLSFEESQLTWRNAIIRDIGGNRMRRESSELIRLDQSWRRELSLRLKIKNFYSNSASALAKSQAVQVL